MPEKVVYVGEGALEFPTRDMAGVVLKRFVVVVTSSERWAL
jgi:hypothetical protein